MSEQSAQSAEFDTVAEWTARVAVDLGPDFHIAAGCRGSGSPAALDWLLRALAVGDRDRMVDLGAGVGGPAAFAHERTGVRPVLTEPEPGACRAAARLFDLPVLRADAARMPFADATFDVVWCLGVLSTAADAAGQLAMLRSAARLVTPRGRIGLLVFVAAQNDLPDPPEGNHFPTAAALRSLLERSRLEVVAQADARTLPDAPAAWQERERVVERELERRYGDTERWRTAQQQSARIGQLLREGRLSAALLSLVPTDANRA